MKYTGVTSVVVILTLMLLDLLHFTTGGLLQLLPPKVPEFNQLPAGEPRKDAFFEFFTPLIRQENDRILALRQKLLKQYQTRGSLTTLQVRHLKRIALSYEMEEFDTANDAHWRTLLRRVDLIPISLALAQAANESAWGTSRFARQANNYFGHWCFVEGCGLVPKRRAQGRKHEVAVFDSPAESVHKYMLNLNRHFAYKELRLKRAKLRQQNQPVTGLALLPALQQYSERKLAYLEEIQEMIHFNGLNHLDRATTRVEAD